MLLVLLDAIEKRLQLLRQVSKSLKCMNEFDLEYFTKLGNEPGSTLSYSLEHCSLNKKFNKLIQQNVSNVPKKPHPDYLPCKYTPHHKNIRKLTS